MENLTRYNCVPIENERRAQKLMSESQKFDRTDSDATSGIGFELAPLSNCSSESGKCSGTFQELVIFRDFFNSVNQCHIFSHERRNFFDTPKLLTVPFLHLIQCSFIRLG